MGLYFLAVYYNARKDNTIQYGTVQCNTIQQNTIHITQNNTPHKITYKIQGNTLHANLQKQNPEHIL
jgi:hypothetical protein